MLFTETNLKNFRTTKNGNFIKGNGHNVYYYHYACLKCGYPFLGTKNVKYCSSKCCYMSDEIISKISASKIGRLNPQWKNGVSVKNIAVYDTYATRLKPYEQCRRSLSDPNILEVKCAYCDKWYVPTMKDVNNRINGLNNNDTHRFYCSVDCKQKCPIFHQKKYFKDKKPYRPSRKYQTKLKEEVYTIDSGICQKCGAAVLLSNSICHHEIAVIVNPLMEADRINCWTLCDRCHKEIHKLPGCNYQELKKC